MACPTGKMLKRANYWEVFESDSIDFTSLFYGCCIFRESDPGDESVGVGTAVVIYNRCQECFQFPIKFVHRDSIPY